MLNTAYFEDDMNQYPMVGFDDNAAISDFDGKGVGWMKMTCALGSPDQVNRFDSIQAERDNQRAAEEEERKRQAKQQQKLNEAAKAGENSQQVEGLLRELIDTIKDSSNAPASRDRGRWIDNQLDSLSKFFEEMRVDNVRDVKLKVFQDASSKVKNSRAVPKADFESDIVDNTPLTRKAVTNITEIWDYRGTNTFDLDELQASYLVYSKYCNFAEAKVRSIFEKLQAFLSLNEDPKAKKKPAEDDEAVNQKNLAALWCKDGDMIEGFNLIVDLFKGGGDPEQAINLKEFMNFVKEPPFMNKDHFSLVGMKHEILTRKVVEDLMKDFNEGVADALLTAGKRDDFLLEPVNVYDFQTACTSNNLEISMWEALVAFNALNTGHDPLKYTEILKSTRDEPERYHL